MIDMAYPGGRALGVDRRRRAADEAPGLAERVAPQRRIQRCVIDLADQFGQFLGLIHGYSQRRTPRPAICCPAAMRRSSVANAEAPLVNRRREGDAPPQERVSLVSPPQAGEVQ